MDTNLPKLLDASEVARILGVRRATVYQAVAAGRLPAIQIWKGRRRALVRFDAADISAFIDARRSARIRVEGSR
jgi:excisionase family DNA binding protein